MVLGKLPVQGRPTIWITVGQGPTALAIGAGGGCLDILLSSILSLLFSFSQCLWETARYRLKYCLKGPLNPKQPTNHGFMRQSRTRSCSCWLVVGGGRVVRRCWVSFQCRGVLQFGL